ncbi:uncharacterized protein EV420DRAFT_1747759 [Desarmillaria tabescens]|uniref:Uncharacterized protein n=1 Tax=Armillaria tabescens TaxID=1929756 RepID=A0AA39KF68_ARMTA|nr:uncharacterized protein EV420DRAFT_1747759 [Desarmillaria tabescens]KAK0458771.1 hypothetical protein EV420DRAFT_1747759 [Desarmillaria tabescens]
MKLSVFSLRLLLVALTRVNCQTLEIKVDFPSTDAQYKKIDVNDSGRLDSGDGEENYTHSHSASPPFLFFCVWCSNDVPLFGKEAVIDVTTGAKWWVLERSVLSTHIGTTVTPLEGYPPRVTR